MAKLIGPIGSKMRGKVGQIVAAKTVGGDTAIRSYQPQVKNPNTLRQRTSRLRLATASGVAAMVAPAISIGFAKAVAGTKMYARNMFVRDIINPSTNAPITITNEVATVDYTKLALSKKAGIAEVLSMQAPSAVEPSRASVAWSVPTISEDLGEGSLGVVVVYVNPAKNACIIVQVEATTASADPLLPLNWEGDTVYVYGFMKWIPATGNDIATSTQPWKYPSPTSACTYAGSAVIQ